MAAPFPNMERETIVNLTNMDDDEPLQTLGLDGEEIEIELDDEGGAKVSFGTDEPDVTPPPEGWFDDLSEFVSSESRSKISRYVLMAVEADRASRQEWEDAFSRGLRLLGLTYEERKEPFEGASGVIHPVLNEAVTQFQAGAYKEILPASGPVKGRIVGHANPELEKQSKRVQDYMNYQIMEVMEEFEPEFDQMLYYLGLNGSTFKKIYRDEMLGRPVSKFVPAEQILVPYKATDLRTNPRATHVITLSKNEFRRLQVSGFYRDVPVFQGPDTNSGPIQEEKDQIEGTDDTQFNLEDEEVTLYECHCYLDIAELPDTIEGEPTGIQLPYIATVCEDNQQVVRLVRNYAEDDPMKNKIAHFVHYKFSPGLGFYGYGLIHLLGNLSRTATANLRQLIDCGTFANMPSGFKARGLRIAGDDEPLRPGEWRDVDVPGGDLRNALLPVPYKEPSPTLFQLLGFVVEAAQRFVGNSDLGIDNANKEMPVGTTLALLERGARVISAVHKRLHASLKLELKMLAKLFGEDPAPYPYPVDGDQQIKAADFDRRVDIIPVSDPNIFSMAQRVILAQEQLTLAQAAPDLHNLREAYRRMYVALGVDNVDALLKPDQEPTPKDPGTEALEASAAATGQGQLYVFPDQDHMAHIDAHMAYMNSTVVTGQPMVQMTLEKHVYEHLSIHARNEAMKQFGLTPEMAQQMQQQGQPMPPQFEGLVAKLQGQLFREHQQKYPPKPQEDPLVELKREEIDIKKTSQEQKAAVDTAKLAQDDAHHEEKLALDERKHEDKMELDTKKLHVQAQAAEKRANQKPAGGGGGK